MSLACMRALIGIAALASLSCAQRSEVEPLLVLSGPKDVVRVQIVDEAGETLWGFEAQPPRNLDAIHYGVVPEGFSQIEPPDGSAPRPLVPGELLIAETMTTRRRFAHTGVAKSGVGMEVLNYTMELVEP